MLKNRKKPKNNAKTVERKTNQEKKSFRKKILKSEYYHKTKLFKIKNSTV